METQKEQSNRTEISWNGYQDFVNLSQKLLLTCLSFFAPERVKKIVLGTRNSSILAAADVSRPCAYWKFNKISIASVHLHLNSIELNSSRKCLTKKKWHSCAFIAARRTALLRLKWKSNPTFIASQQSEQFSWRRADRVCLFIQHVNKQNACTQFVLIY